MTYVKNGDGIFFSVNFIDYVVIADSHPVPALRRFQLL